jgi:hypothetical protein
MPSFRDLTGRQFGRLQVVAKTDKRNSNGNVMWLCHCDCGNDCLVSSRDLTNGATQSCGCLRIERSREASKAKRTVKICPVCGKAFEAPPTGRATCSEKCERKYRAQAHKGVSNRWNAESRRKKSAQGMTDNLRAGTPAAKKSPLAGRFETNQEAKRWVIKSPEGKTYEFTNLRLWAREHTALFGKPPGDRSAGQIAQGFYSAYMAQRNVGEHHTLTYKDWKLLAVKTIKK